MDKHCSRLLLIDETKSNYRLFRAFHSIIQNIILQLLNIKDFKNCLLPNNLVQPVQSSDRALCRIPMPSKAKGMAARLLWHQVSGTSYQNIWEQFPLYKLPEGFKHLFHGTPQITPKAKAWDKRNGTSKQKPAAGKTNLTPTKCAGARSLRLSPKHHILAQSLHQSEIGLAYHSQPEGSRQLVGNYTGKTLCWPLPIPAMGFASQYPKLDRNCQTILMPVWDRLKKNPFNNS